MEGFDDRSAREGFDDRSAGEGFEERSAMEGSREPTGGTPLRSRGMLDRMKGAAMLDVATYEEVEADTTALGQAAGVVVIVAICQAIGTSGEGIGTALLAGVAALIGWLIWAGITYLVGDKMLGGTATWGELLRTLGFAQAPGVLYVLAIIPILGWLVSLGVGIWILVAGIIAIRQALDFSTGKAILTAVIGWIVMFVGTMMVGLMGMGSALF